MPVSASNRATPHTVPSSMSCTSCINSSLVVTLPPSPSLVSMARRTAAGDTQRDEARLDERHAEVIVRNQALALVVLDHSAFLAGKPLETDLIEPAAGQHQRRRLFAERL